MRINNYLLRMFRYIEGELFSEDIIFESIESAIRHGERQDCHSFKIYNHNGNICHEYRKHHHKPTYS
jgi:hypothetical protein